MVIVLHILFQVCPPGAPSVWLLCLFNMTHFQSLPYFLVQKGILESSDIFPIPALESAISPDLVSFSREWYSEIKVWAPGMLIATGLSFPVGPLRAQS